LEKLEIDKATENEFKTALMKAANITDSWIITTGINTGVSKLGKKFLSLSF
jgi:hypothetical protein